MSEIRKILMPTDFSPNANQAFRYAAMLADRFGAQLTILHVVSLFQDDSSNSEHHFPVLGEFYDKMEKNAAFKMDQFTFDCQHIEIHTETRRGFSPAEEIINYAKEQKVGLIVMGTHGRSAIAHFLVGSVAEKVVRHAGMPVLTVSHQEGQMYQFPKVGRILVPIDFSDSSKAAITYAGELARPLGASLIFFHVVDQRLYPAYHFTVGEPVRSLEPSVFQEARQGLESFVGDSVPPYVKTEFLVREGNPHAEIVGYTDKNGVDLIVMATHGLSGLDRLLIGSTTEKVVRKATSPVLTVAQKVQTIQE